MKRLTKVAVMLSAYNGEKYIQQQIDSILNQKNVEIYLYIRDDGSTDNTAKILRRYEVYSNIFISYGKNIGFQRSFMHLIEYVDRLYDYYAFSDQDDIWENDKIFCAIQLLNKHNCSLYTSALKVVNENLELLYINKFKNLKVSFGSAISRQRLAGCTMVFNANILELASKFPIEDYYNYFSHDAIIYYLCLATGKKIYFDSNSHILFRRHDGTVTEHGKGLLKRVYSVTNIFKECKSLKSKQIEILYNYYRDFLPENIINYCNIIMNYKKSILNTLNFAFNREKNCQIISVDIINFIAILLRTY